MCRVNSKSAPRFCRKISKIRENVRHGAITAAYGQHDGHAASEKPSLYRHMVQCKRKVSSFKTKKRLENSSEDWVIVEDIYEALIDSHTWELGQEHFHDLRHSYAVAAIRSGDDIKTVQSNLGHATAAFTLDVYGHCTDQMKKESAKRMEMYIKNVLNL